MMHRARGQDGQPTAAAPLAPGPAAVAGAGTSVTPRAAARERESRDLHRRMVALTAALGVTLALAFMPATALAAPQLVTSAAASTRAAKAAGTTTSGAAAPNTVATKTAPPAAATPVAKASGAKDSAATAKKTTKTAVRARRGFAGRPLSDALHELRAEGLALVFSSELVRADMIVATEPTAASPREVLDEVLAPHGLRAKSGPKGMLLVVKGPAVRVPPVIRLPGDSREPAPGRPLEPRPPNYHEQVTVSAPAFTPPAERLVPAQQALGHAGIQELQETIADDPFRALHALPGVTAADDFRSDFAVRGADLRHTGLTIDGVATPWLLHTTIGAENVGSIAMLNGDTLDRMWLAAGSYPQRYGNRTGAWLDTTIREGSRDSRGVRGILGASAASLVGDGPIGSHGSWLGSVRQSFQRLLLTRIEDQEARAGFEFTDLQSKVVYDVNAHHQLQGTLIAGRSTLDPRDARNEPRFFFDVEHGSSRAALATVALRSAPAAPVVVTHRAAVVAQHFASNGQNDRALAAGEFREWSYRTDMTWLPSRGPIVEAGGAVQHQREAGMDATLLALDHKPDTAPAMAEYAGTAWLNSAFVQATWQGRHGLTVSPGLRVVHASLIGDTSVLPWFQAAWQRGAFTLRGGGGLYSQTPEFTDVLSRVVGDPNLRSERARHADFSIEHQFTPRLSWQASVFSRAERDYVRVENREFRIVDGIVNFPALGRAMNALNGGARGYELLLRRSDPRGMSGWLSYAFARVRYDDVVTGEQFYGDDDQRHTVNAFVQMPLSDRMAISSKFRYGSNLPIPGYYQAVGNRVYVIEGRNLSRPPTYARWDVRAHRTFPGPKRRFTLFAEVLNVLGRDNYGPLMPNAVRVPQPADLTQKLFPMVPSVGLIVDFRTR